jgi:hypothetical protein
VLFQDSQNLGSQGSLDMYTLHEVNTKLLLVVASELKKTFTFPIGGTYRYIRYIYETSMEDSNESNSLPKDPESIFNSILEDEFENNFEMNWCMR